ncbi:DUF805 domain-containing protein [Pseudoalteromonas sp. YIC-656]|uniref:DUF805 domain-containing protein n=1 Tax=Pseudoalteromonas pernae TaxID=3118054 RepID=UPI0032425CBE
MNWYIEALKKYAHFKGRARRTEFWMFILFYNLVLFGLMFIDMALGTYDSQEGIGDISALYVLATFIPTIAVNVRRLHDVGYSGWWFLLWFIPLLGHIALVVMYCQDSKSGETKHGPSPKEPEVAAA